MLNANGEEKIGLIEFFATDYQTRMKIKTEIDCAIIKVTNQNEYLFLRPLKTGEELDFILDPFKTSEARIFLIVYRHQYFTAGKISPFLIKRSNFQKTGGKSRYYFACELHGIHGTHYRH